MKDLTNIPKRFHVLFTTDWNNGNENEMNSIQRGTMSVLFLEYNKWDVQRMIDSKRPIEEDLNIGFEKF
jgi:hypothetical protein